MNARDESERKLTDDELFQLLEEARKGDGAAQNEFFNAYMEELMIAIRSSRRRTPLHRRVEETMDVCNTVVRRLLSKWENHAFRDFGDFRKLIRTIVQRRIQRAVGKFITEKKAAEAAALLNDDVGGSCPKIEESEFLQFIRSQLPASVQPIFDAIYIEGKTYEELSKQYPVSASALRKQLRRALERIVEELDLNDE